MDFIDGSRTLLLKCSPQLVIAQLRNLGARRRCFVQFAAILAAVLLSGCVQYTEPERHLFLAPDDLYGDWFEIAMQERGSGVKPSPGMVSMEKTFARQPDPELAYKLASLYAPLDLEGIYPAPVNRMTRAYELLVFAAVNGHRRAVIGLASIFEDGPMDHPVDKDTASCLHSAAEITYVQAVASATVACGITFDGFSPARLPARLKPPPLTPAVP